MRRESSPHSKEGIVKRFVESAVTWKTQYTTSNSNSCRCKFRKVVCSSTMTPPYYYTCLCWLQAERKKGKIIRIPVNWIPRSTITCWQDREGGRENIFSFLFSRQRTHNTVDSSSAMKRPTHPVEKGCVIPPPSTQLASK